MKAIVVAGNGPSLATIDYRRIPKEFDVFRCNHFYMEKMYFLGKDVTGYFVSAYVLETLNFHAYILKERKEYNIGTIYPVIQPEVYKDEFTVISKNDLKILDITNAYSLLRTNKQIYELLYAYRYFGVCPTKGVSAVLVAIIQGYTDVYITGIDFYQTQSHVYNSNLIPCDHKWLTEGVESPHLLELDYKAIKLAASFPNVNLYSISSDSPITELLPLAPIQNDTPYVPEEKPVEAITDLIYSYRCPIAINKNKVHNKGKIQKIKQLFKEKNLFNEWEFLRNNGLIKFIYQTIKLPYIILKILIKIIK